MAVHVLKHRQITARRRPQLEAVGQPAEPEGFDRAYWLSHSEGYRVDGRDGRIGFVEATRPDPGRPGVTLLVIRAGALGRRQVVASSDAVAAIVPRAERIWLNSSARLSPVG